MPGLPYTFDTTTHIFPPSNWLLILMDFSGWDFPWLLNEASAVWPLTLEPRNLAWTAKSLPKQPHKPHCHSPCQKTNRARVVWTSPPSSPASPSLLWQELQTENGVTPGVQLIQALQRKHFTVVKKINHKFQRKNPTEGIEQRHSLWLRKHYLQKPKILKRKTTCLSWWLWLARKGETSAQHSNLDLCPSAGSERQHQQSPVSTRKPLLGKDDPAGTFSL